LPLRYLFHPQKAMKDEAFRVLLVDGASGVCDHLALLIKSEGMTPLVAHDAKTALDRIRLASPDLLVTDFRLADLDGLELLQRAKSLDNNLPVVIMTEHAEINGAIKAIKASAFHYMEKPLKSLDFIHVVREGIAERRLRLKQTSNPLSATHHLVETMGPSDLVGELAIQVNRVSKSNFSVVILGETGAGKEVVARAMQALAELALLFRSIAEQFLRRCSKRNSSATKRELSPVRSITNAGNSNWPMVAPCSWTRC